MGGRAGAIVVVLVSVALYAASAAAYPGRALVAKYQAKQAHRIGVARVWQRRALHRLGGTIRVPAAAGARRTAAKPTLSTVGRDVLDRINAVRARHGLRPLVLSRGLMAAARQHSLEMVRQGYFAHESADGSSFDRRIRRYYRRLRSAGENIAFGCPDLGAEEAMKLWMESAGHRRNILDPRWREIGISIVHVDSAPGPDYRGDPTTVATTDFGRR